jgi:hypothetical protein
MRRLSGSIPFGILISCLLALGLWDGTARGDGILWGMHRSLAETALLLSAGILLGIRFLFRGGRR